MKNKLDKKSKTLGKNPATPGSAQPGAKAASEKSKAKATPPEESKPRKEAKSAPEAQPRAGRQAKSRPQETAAAESGRTRHIAAAPAKGDKGARRPAGAIPTEAETGELGLEEFAISLIQPGGKEERVWRTKNFEQLSVKREFGFPDVAPELPGQYGNDKLVLMPKDPEYMFCYWELTPTLLTDKEREKLPSDNYRETMKINWESKSLFEPNFTFIPVFFWARKWYFGVPQIGQRYQVELGWLSDSGHFISIIRSNLSELPESWAATQKRLADSGEVLSHTVKHTRTLGASEHLAVEDTRAFSPQWNLSSESMSSSSWSRGRDPAELAAAAKAAEAGKGAAGKAEKRVPATPRARLEVSGKVFPGTRILIGGNAVATDTEGNFRAEFPHDQDYLSLEITSRTGASRSFTYDLKELVLT